MLKHMAEQVSRLSGGIVGATLGVIFSMSTHRSFTGAVAFLLVFFILYAFHSLPTYLVKTKNGIALTWISFLIHFCCLVVAAFWFCHLWFLTQTSPHFFEGQNATGGWHFDAASLV
jgi:hypothetical protein